MSVVNLRLRAYDCGKKYSTQKNIKVSQLWPQFITCSKRGAKYSNSLFNGNALLIKVIKCSNSVNKKDLCRV